MQRGKFDELRDIVVHCDARRVAPCSYFVSFGIADASPSLGDFCCGRSSAIPRFQAGQVRTSAAAASTASQSSRPFSVLRFFPIVIVAPFVGGCLQPCKR
jgi:hypothetical protein